MSPFRASAGFTERWEHFDLAIADGVATVTFQRPDRRVSGTARCR